MNERDVLTWRLQLMDNGIFISDTFVYGKCYRPIQKRELVEIRRKACMWLASHGLGPHRISRIVDMHHTSVMYHIRPHRRIQRRKKEASSW